MLFLHLLPPPAGGLSPLLRPDPLLKDSGSERKAAHIGPSEGCPVRASALLPLTYWPSTYCTLLEYKVRCFCPTDSACRPRVGEEPGWFHPVRERGVPSPGHQWLGRRRGVHLCHGIASWLRAGGEDLVWQISALNKALYNPTPLHSLNLASHRPRTTHTYTPIRQSSPILHGTHSPSTSLWLNSFHQAHHQLL